MIISLILLLTWIIPTDKKIVSLTFDDEPSKNTKKILKILKENNLKCSFFILGIKIPKNEDLVRMIKQENHDIGNHLYEHWNFKKIPIQKQKKLFEEGLIKTEKLLISITGEKPKYLRIPHGFYRKWVGEIAKKHNYKIIGWTFGYDWLNISEKELKNKYLSSLKKGSIILFHPTNKTVKILPQLIKEIKANGYEILPLSEVIKN